MQVGDENVIDFTSPDLVFYHLHLSTLPTIN